MKESKIKVIDTDLIFYELISVIEDHTKKVKELEKYITTQKQWEEIVNSIHYVSELLLIIVSIEKMIKIYLGLENKPRLTLGGILNTHLDILSRDFPKIDFERIRKTRNALLHGNINQYFQNNKIKNTEGFFEYYLSKDSDRNVILKNIFDISKKLFIPNPLKDLVLKKQNLIQIDKKYNKKIQRNEKV